MPDETQQTAQDQPDPQAVEAAMALVLSSEADQERAEAMARALLERRLVACVSLLPVQSHYRWQGRLETAAEVKLLLKTQPHKLPALHAALLELHSYDTPEWIVLEGVARGGYGQWLDQQLQLDEPDADRDDQPR